MKHPRADYQRRIIDTDNLIPEDEPVMLFRAQDKHFLTLLSHYDELLTADPATNGTPMHTALKEHHINARYWTAFHGAKTPDVPREA